MNPDELQQKITDLVNYNPGSEAEWVERIKSEPTEVISGAMYKWADGGGVSTGHTKANLRESANAILQSRLTDQITSTMTKLNNSARWLTWIGIGLTLIGAVYALRQLLEIGT